MPDVDAIVVGSGSGGLTAALALARAGQSVAVFERHTLPGGYSQSFTLSGFSFSPGIHYIGQLDPGGGLRRIYEGLGVANDLLFLELDPDGYDRVFVGDERFDIPKGREHFEQRLKRRFPSEARGIERYFDLVHRMSEEIAFASPRGALDAALLPVRMRTVLRHGLRPLAHFLDGITKDPLLRAILSIQAGDHGMAPSRAPTALHAGLQSYYFDGACYPHGGGHAIPDALVRRIEAEGSRVVLGNGVAGILMEGGRVAGVVLDDGTEVRSDVVVSNADPGMTWGRLMPRDAVPSRLRRRIEKLSYSVSTVSLFLGVDMDLREAGFDSGNVWYSETPDVDAAYRLADRGDWSGISEMPGLFFNVTTLKDPTLRQDGLHTVEAMALARWRSFERWAETDHAHRPSDYLVLKERLGDAILAAIERFAPGLRDRVVFRSVATPLTNQRFLAAADGAIYGAEKTLRNLGPFSFPLRTAVPGLYQCGANTLSPGIHGVTKSGVAVAAAVLGCHEADLLTATGQALRIVPADSFASRQDPAGRDA